MSNIHINIGEEIKPKGMETLFKEVIENFPNLGKDMGVQEQDAFKTPK